jgi:ABC-type multidrug transport system ATPase subunit
LNIELINISRRFGKFVALQDVNLKISPGETVGILGPNGSGKTTLINILVGFLRPTTGQVLYDGVELEQVRSKVLPKIGALIEIPRLYPYLSARQNLEMFCTLSGHDHKRTDELLDTVKLADTGSKPFAAFSLGMKQRLGIALALLNDPEFLIFDEPTNGLDPEGIVEIRDILKKLSASGRSVILCSHLLPEVELLCSEVVILDHGIIRARDKIHTIQTTVQNYLIGANEPKELEQAVAALSGTVIKQYPEGRMEIAIPGEHNPAQVLRTLVEKGVPINLFSPHHQNLEDFFIKTIQTPKAVK